ncbi:Fpg/Nei family DNA glycosylase [Palleronia abyssalis]|uniref:Formamidopyrimidine-DNA glycosylase n=1 Tax=Palleronia abyssalis TaxID=1501240 RepID=A0A2R8BTI4_9RHOB|nr:DNA-formamidopyrimidine glycosylase family protein [Palleronia abyssalis]SPJ23474.1 Formamidopyrimidine-DNA glycosylase [Palleronia abyssalis]
MPELPEAEANRRRVEAMCLNRTIVSVEAGDDVQYITLPGGNARQRLVGHQFTETRRHGKLIFAGSKTGPWIAVHLGMSGSLRPYDDGGKTPDYRKLIIAFEGDRRLAFRCPRKLGWVHVIDDPETFIRDEGYGPDALEISREAFRDVIGGTRGAVKSALMDQKKLAGIGNLWSDEILFQTGTSPTAKAADLDGDRLDALHDKMPRVLEAVAATDMDYSKLPGDWLIPNRTEGADCPVCDGTIVKRKVGGRTSYFCDTHQA